MGNQLFRTRFVRSVLVSTALLVLGCQSSVESPPISLNGTTERGDNSQIVWTLENLKKVSPIKSYSLPKAQDVRRPARVPMSY